MTTTINGIYALPYPSSFSDNGYSYVAAINEEGQVAGNFDTGTGVDIYTALWTGKAPASLGALPGDTFSEAIAINDSGEVVGDSGSISAVTSHAVLWRNGALTEIGDASSMSKATGINDAGTVVGFAGTEMRAFMWQNGTLTYLADLPGVSNPGSFDSIANAVNQSGQIVGGATSSQDDALHAVLWYQGSVTDLGVLPGATDSQATHINDQGDVIGISGSQNFLWKNGVMQALAAPAGFATASLYGINDSDMIVGTATPASGSVWDRRAFIWQTGTATDLNSLLPANSGWVLLDATGINDKGEIVGRGTYDGFTANYVLTLGEALPSMDAQSALVAVKAGGLSFPLSVTDTTADIQSALDALETMAAAGQLNTVTLSDSDTDNFSGAWPVISITGHQLAADALVFADITSNYRLAVTGDVTASALTQNLVNHLPASLTITDSAANLSANLYTIAGITFGTDVTVHLTDSGVPTVIADDYAFATDQRILDGIDGSFTVKVLMKSTYGLATAAIPGHGITAVFSGPASDYTLGTGADGSLTITGGGVSDGLAGVGALQFSDLTLMVAAKPGAGTVTTGNITELYSAVFAREPDLAGLSFYQSYLAAHPNTSLLQFAEWFLGSAEYAQNMNHTYAETADGDARFITDSYQNLLDRTPSTSDVSFYQSKVLQPAVAGLTPGTAAYAAAQTQAHAQMLVYFSASSEFLSDVQVTAQSPASAQHWLVLV